MSKPNAVLSFEGTSTELNEAQLIRIAKLLLTDEDSRHNLKEFNEVYLPVMSVASAMAFWREPPLPEPVITSSLRIPMYSYGRADYFMDDKPEFSRSVIGPDGDLLKTYPLMTAEPINLLAFTEGEGADLADLADVVLGLKVQRVYVKLDDVINAIDVSTNITAKFIRNLINERQLLLNLISAGELIKLTASCDPVRGTVRFNSHGEWEVVAVDLEVERGNYNCA